LQKRYLTILFLAGGDQVVKGAGTAVTVKVAALPSYLKKFVFAVAGLMGTVSFTEWVGKEAGVEILDFPLSDAIRNERWEEAKELLPKHEKNVEVTKELIDKIAWIVPPTKELWNNYVESALLKVEEYRKTIETESPPKPLEPGEVPEIITGEVTGVIDGDTIDVKDMLGHVYRIRLIGIDAPEFSTIAGKASGKFLTDLIHGKRVEVKTDPLNNLDKYGRILGVVFLGQERHKQRIIEKWLC